MRRRSLLALPLAAGCGRSRTPAPEAVVAVVPFAGDEAPAAALTREVTQIAALSPGLNVIGVTSAASLRGISGQVEAAARMGAGRVIEGSLERSGEHWEIRIRITPGGPLPVVSALDLRGARDQALRQVGTALGTAGAAVKNTPAAALPLASPAWEAAARARWELNRNGASQRTRDSIDAALRADPQCAEALAALADWHYARGAYDDARGAAGRAVRLDPLSAAAHARLGAIALAIDRDPQEARLRYTAAFRADRSLSAAGAREGFARMIEGQTDLGLKAVRDAVRFDPLSGNAQNDLVFALYLARQFREAILQSGRVIDLNAAASVSYYRRAWTHAAAGHWQEALADAETMRKLRAGAAQVESLRGYVLGRTGRLAEAAALARGLPDYAVALVALGGGDLDTVFDRLHRCADGVDPYLIYVTVEPVFGPARADPRYAALEARLVRRKNRARTGLLP